MELDAVQDSGKKVSQFASQEEFDAYIRKLPFTKKCMLITGTVVALCSDCTHRCVYRGDETYTLRYGKLPECKRENMLRLKRILGERK